MKRLLPLVCALVFMSSCAPKILIQEAYLLEDEYRSESADNRVDLRTYYVGDAHDYISFQIDIDNRSNDTISIDERDIFLLIDNGRARGNKIYPIAKLNFIQSLSLEASNLNREKKENTAANIIFAGLDILGAVSSGAGATETVLYGTTSAVGIMENRRGYDEAEMTIDEMIAYHEDYTLEYAIIPPGESGTYDIHFDRLLHDGYCELDILCSDRHYTFGYDLEVIETKLR